MTREPRKPAQFTGGSTPYTRTEPRSRSVHTSNDTPTYQFHTLIPDHFCCISTLNVTHCLCTLYDHEWTHSFFQHVTGGGRVDSAADDRSAHTVRSHRPRPVYTAPARPLHRASRVPPAVSRQPRLPGGTPGGHARLREPGRTGFTGVPQPGVKQPPVGPALAAGLRMQSKSYRRSPVWPIPEHQGSAQPSSPRHSLVRLSSVWMKVGRPSTGSRREFRGETAPRPVTSLCSDSAARAAQSR